MQFGTSKLEPDWYTATGLDGQPTDVEFHIIPLNARERASVVSTMSATGEPNAESCLRAFELGVRQIRGATDPEGKPIRTPRQFLAYGDTFEMAVQVGGEVLARTWLDDDAEVK